jgi:hypothetical protein
LPVTKTVSFENSFSNTSFEGGAIKKKKKNKKIKDLSPENNDEIIVIEAGEILEDSDKKDNRQPYNLTEENENVQIEGNSVIMGQAR